MSNSRCLLTVENVHLELSKVLDVGRVIGAAKQRLQKGEVCGETPRVIASFLTVWKDLSQG